MKFIIKIILVTVLAFIGQLFLPFWVVAVAGILASLIIRTKGFSSFISGFLGVFILWFLSAYLVDNDTSSLLSQKMTTIIPVGSVFMLILVTAFIGGLAGGFGALTGSMLGALLSKEKPSRY